jgi:hypothetical protein
VRRFVDFVDRLGGLVALVGLFAWAVLAAALLPGGPREKALAQGPWAAAVLVALCAAAVALGGVAAKGGGR